MTRLAYLGIGLIFLYSSINDVSSVLTFLHYENIKCEGNTTAAPERIFCKKSPCSTRLHCVEKSPNLCSLNTPCLNGGKCRAQPDGDFTCTCVMGIYGRYCQTIII